MDVARKFEQLEESCVPSYVHRNIAASGVAWLRLLNAAAMYERFAGPGPILDFGSATGEINQVLKGQVFGPGRPPQPYNFCELNEALAKANIDMNPGATRLTLESLPANGFAAVFALDSLEHNENVGELLDSLTKALRHDGVLILSGPTENWLYRTGRRIAGFSGHYHKTTIRNIEDTAAQRLSLVHRKLVPFGVPLFSVSVWRRRA